MKRIKTFDMSTLPKRVKLSHHMQAAATQDNSSRADASGTTTIMSTVVNAKCAHLIGIPHEALREDERIGAGSFGICRIYNIKGISIFLEHMQYVGKCYKGGEATKFDSFQTEQGMQILHPSIIRCIGGFTTEAPWITFFHCTTEVLVASDTSGQTWV